jgi:hypothetical protein
MSSERFFQGCMTLAFTTRLMCAHGPQERLDHKRETEKRDKNVLFENAITG